MHIVARFLVQVLTAVTLAFVASLWPERWYAGPAVYASCLVSSIVVVGALEGSLAIVRRWLV